MVIDNLSIFIPRILLGALFLFSSTMKLTNLKGFYLIFLQYGLVKGSVAKPFAYLLVFSELLVGILLLINWQLFYAGIGALIILIGSTYGVLYIYLGKRKMENCGCFGTAIKIPIDGRKVIENAVWILLNIV